MALEVKITKKDGSQIIYDLITSSKLKFVDQNRKVVLLFDSGEIYKGFTDGVNDEESDFCVRTNPEDKICVALPFNRLLGWAYEDEGRHKLSLWNRLRLGRLKFIDLVTQGLTVAQIKSRAKKIKSSNK